MTTINGKPLSTISTLVTSQTTSEGNFRIGIEDIATETDEINTLLTNGGTEPRIPSDAIELLRQAEAVGVVQSDWDSLAGFGGGAVDLNAAQAFRDASLPIVGRVLSVAEIPTPTTTGVYTWVDQNSPFIVRDDIDNNLRTIAVGETLFFDGGEGIITDFTAFPGGTGVLGSPENPFTLTFNLSDMGVTNAKILDGTIQGAKITTDTIANNNLVDVAANTVKANATAGPVVDLTIATNTVLGRGTGTLGSTQVLRDMIGADAVDSSKIADNAVGNLQLNNAASFTAVDFTATSDRRLKDNIETITDALDKVNAMRGVTYTMLGKDSIGVIAQEMEEIVPEVVKTNDDGMMSVSYMHLVGVLIESIKELSAKVEKLEGK